MSRPAAWQRHVPPHHPSRQCSKCAFDASNALCLYFCTCCILSDFEFRSYRYRRQCLPLLASQSSYHRSSEPSCSALFAFMSETRSRFSDVPGAFSIYRAQSFGNYLHSSRCSASLSGSNRSEYQIELKEDSKFTALLERLCCSTYMGLMLITCRFPNDH